MSSIFPLKPSSSLDDCDCDTDPKLVEFTGTEAEQIFSSVSSMTARTILETLYEEPQTASDIAECLDASVQNVSYHLDRLSDANLVEVAGTWYSGQGREMDVYAPANGPLVLYTGAERATPSLSSALQRVFGAIALVGLVSAGVHARWSAAQPTQPAPLTRAEPPEPTLWETVLEFGTGPGGFVLGTGLLAISCWFLYWYWQYYRPSQHRQAHSSLGK